MGWQGSEQNAGRALSGGSGAAAAHQYKIARIIVKKRLVS